MLGRLRTIVLGLAAATSVACGAPSSFDGLTGGSKEDASLDAPRPMSPLSVTMVSTSRPHLKWELFGKETGAVVELCKTRDFAAGTVKRFEATGRDLVVPEDLEPGMWFWRLTAKSEGVVGTATSPTWEVLVRGPAAHGSSEVPFGAIADVDGDGRPDLITAGDPSPMPGETMSISFLLVFTNALDGSFATDTPQMRGIYTDSQGLQRELGFMSVASGIDYDGDGYADMAYSGLAANVDQWGDKRYDVVVENGGKWDPTGNTLLGASFPRVLPFPDAIPTLAEGGDLNGDGYGDLLMGDAATSNAIFGAKGGPSANVFFAYSEIAEPGSPSRLVHGGFDVDGDGLSDLVFGPASPPSTGGVAVKQAAKLPSTSPEFAGDPATSILAMGSGGMSFDKAKLLSLASSADVHAKAFTSGDFDGDGIPDVASTVPDNGNVRVCVWFGNRERGLVPGPCAAGLGGDTELGASLAAGDIEGDGKDEILATVKTGGASAVRVLHLGDAGIDVAPIGTPGFGQHLTTVWPGRPGKARWAAIGDDGTIGVFEAGTLAQTVTRPRFIRDNFGRALR